MTNGRIIGVPNVATVGSAPGVWDLNDVQQARQTNSWPRADLIAEGGSVTTVTIGPVTYRVHTFTGAGVFQLYRNYPIQYLVVGGGGGGGATGFPTYGGGGGAGGLLTNVPIPGYPQYAGSVLNAVAGAYPIVVGSGGAQNTPGTPSAFNYTPSLYVSVAGGRGGGGPNGATGGPGGSGGGGAVTYPFGQAGGSGIAGQGFAGGSAGGTSGLTAGGGGAGGVGAPGPSPTPRAGPGVPINFNGTTITYSRGGGQLNDPTWAPGTGNGGIARYPGGLGARPGDNGIVIIRYAI